MAKGALGPPQYFGIFSVLIVLFFFFFLRVELLIPDKEKCSWYIISGHEEAMAEPT